MKLDRNQRHARFAWLFLATMLVLCTTLGFLQYRWIDEASRAERERLRGSLQASLFRLSIGFNSDLTSACAAFLPRNGIPGSELSDAEYTALYRQWRESSQHDGLFAAIGVAAPSGPSLSLRLFDLKAATLQPAPWPAHWLNMKDSLEIRLAQAREGREGRPGGGNRFRGLGLEDGYLIEVPRRGRPDPDARSLPEWFVFEVNREYLRGTLLPELLQRHLGSNLADYQVEIVSRQEPSKVLYTFPEGASFSIGSSADAAVPLFDVSWDQIFRRNAPPGVREMMRGRPAPGPWGRWELRLRHRSGSLAAVVAQTRLRNLAVTAAVLLLMLATAAALVQFTRRAQRLATLQMNFVAGVSHELRTPLTVIRTAAFNLRGKVAQNPVQVEKYGSLIQQESERLSNIVEQVLQFASQEAGRTRLQFEPLSAGAIIDESVLACQSVVDASGCAVEKDIPSGLPLLRGDPVALKHAVQNLIINAAKYGAAGSPAGQPCWIGVSAALAGSEAVEIRVADRGPGIPPEEIASVFEPFFRGQRAIHDQVHGTGLGLAIVKGIVDAHEGSVFVSSDPGRYTQFSIRLPIAGISLPTGASA